MKVAGGAWRGRPLLMPKSELVRPTQDRVREALFNLLMQVIQGARFLDLFAGSGAVGIEALSRGAASATFLEQDRTVFATLQKNLAAFGIESTCAKQLNALEWLGLEGNARVAPLAQPFTIVFADPPYRWAAEQGVAPIAEALAKSERLIPGGFFIAETDFRTDPVEIPDYTLVRDREYGKTRLTIYQRA